MVAVTQDSNHFSVAIVGAGPIGLTLANLLGLYGVRTIIVERNSTTVEEPRAVSIDDEALRTMQAAGLVENVLEHVVPGYGSEYLTSQGRCFLTVEPSGQPFGYPRRNAFRQPVLERQLREGLKRFAQTSEAFGWKMTQCHQSESFVAVDLEGESGTRTITCDYLVGCDGARSAVRKAIGSKLEGDSFAERWLVVDLDNSPTMNKNTIVYCNHARPCIALPGPSNTRRFEFKLHRSERDADMLADPVVSHLLAVHGADPGSVLKRKVVYTFHARIAARWSRGRVFLAGDAAHLTPPFAGQGMNSGIRDAHNLAWKLAAVTNGRLPRAILDTYETERRDHMAQMLRLALAMGRVMGPRSRFHEWLTQTAFQFATLWPAAKRFFGEMRYKPKPHITEGFLIKSQTSVGRNLVGFMLPQPIVTSPDGSSSLLDEHLGQSFALLSIGTSTSAPMASGLKSRLRLKRVQLALRPFACNPSAIWLADAASPLAQLEGLTLLVRPDKYVAAVWDSKELGNISSQIGNLCG